MADERFDSVLEESRRFPPPADFTQSAHIKSLHDYEKLYKQSIEDPHGFWSEIARELHWFKPWTRVLEWNPPFARWFTGGLLNAAYNCLDRHLDTERADRRALVWEGEPGDERTYTYRQLHEEVSRFASALKELGVKKGDRVAIYLPMIPEAAIAMLACARIGAPHSVVFGGFSSQALRDRIEDARAKVLITADGGYRRGRVVALKRNADEAVAGLDFVEHVVVVRRHDSGETIGGAEMGSRDRWYHELVAAAHADCPAEPMDSGHDGNAERRGAHHRRLPDAGLRDHPLGVRPSRRRHLLVHGGRRLGYRSLLHRVRPSR